MKFNLALASFVATTLTAVSAAPAPEFKYMTVRRPNDPKDVQCVSMQQYKPKPEMGDVYVIKPCDQLGNFADPRIKFVMDTNGLKTNSDAFLAAWGFNKEGNQGSLTADRKDASDQERKFDWKNVGTDGFGNIFTDEVTEIDGCLTWEEKTNFLVFNYTNRNALYEHTNESCAQFRFANLKLTATIN